VRVQFSTVTCVVNSFSYDIVSQWGRLRKICKLIRRNTRLTFGCDVSPLTWLRNGLRLEVDWLRMNTGEKTQWMGEWKSLRCDLTVEETCFSELQLVRSVHEDGIVCTAEGYGEGKNEITRIIILYSYCMRRKCTETKR
jgi:hypothetical protein